MGFRTRVRRAVGNLSPQTRGHSTGKLFARQPFPGAPLPGALLAGALLAGALAAGCGDEVTHTDRAPAPPAAPPAEQAPTGPVLYDAEGRLLESELSVAGLKLPVGLTRAAYPDDNHRIYWAKGIEREKLIAYFGPRLFTGQIKRAPAGLTYVDAVPMHKRNSKTRLTVAVAERKGKRVKVTIDLRLPPPLKVMPLDTLKKQLREEQKTIE